MIGSIAGALYCKGVEASDDSGLTVMIRFSSMSTEIEKFLSGLLENSKAEAAAIETASARQSSSPPAFFHFVPNATSRWCALLHDAPIAHTQTGAMQSKTPTQEHTPMFAIIFTRKILVAATLAAALLSNGASVHAAEGADLGTMKPLHAISFALGDKNAVSFFLAESGSCKLVLTIAGEPNWGEFASLLVARFEATIPAGKTTRFQGEGQAVEFSCHSGAVAMSATAVNQIAAQSAVK